MTKLRIVPAAEQQKDAVIELLKDAITRVENGEPATDCLIVLMHPGGDYTELASPTIGYQEWLGKMHQIIFARQLSHNMEATVVDKSE